MVDNQHRQITGYRELTQEEIDLINDIKSFAAQTGELIGRVKALPVAQYMPDHTPTPNTSFDPRWAAIAMTHLQQGYMALIRSVAKPTTF